MFPLNCIHIVCRQASIKHLCLLIWHLASDSVKDKDSGSYPCVGMCRLSTDLGSFVGLSHESSSLGGSSPLQSPGPSVCPFPMPAQYEEAKESKVQTVATLRNSIKSVSAQLWHY